MEIEEKIKSSNGGKMSTLEYKGIKPTPKPEWEWCFGGHWFSLTVGVPSVPNIIVRFFQKLFLDIHWRKIEEK